MLANEVFLARVMPLNLKIPQYSINPLRVNIGLIICYLNGFLTDLEKTLVRIGSYANISLGRRLLLLGRLLLLLSCNQQKILLQMNLLL